MVLRNLEVIEYPGDEVEFADAVASLSNAAHLITADAELNLVNQYWLKIAPPNELADYIVKQPNHTWNGITIYPGEAWRYRDTDLWITWRTYDSKIARKLHEITRGGPVEWSEEWIP